MGHFLKSAPFARHTRAIGWLFRLPSCGNLLDAASEDSQCASLRSPGPRRTVEDHFHKVKIGEEVEGVIWKRALPTELVIHACDTANDHRVGDARVDLVKDGSGATEPRINVAEFEYRPRRHGRAWNRRICDVISGCDTQ